MTSGSSSAADSRAAFTAARDLCRRADGAAGEAYRAAFFLPREKREAIYAIAAFGGFMRQALDSGGGSEGCCGGSDGVTAAVKSRIDALYAEQIELPLPEFRDPSQWTFAAMAEVVKRFEIPRAYLHDLADGLAADRKVQRYATWTALRRHCESVGGSGAKMAACVLGVTHSDGAVFAGKVGAATRLVLILEQFASNLKQDRIYLPLEDLARFRCASVGVAPTEDLVRFEVSRARELLIEGSEGLCWLAGDGSRMAAAMFIAKQTERLDAIERAGFNLLQLDKSRSSSPVRKLRQLSAAWRLARRTSDEPLPRVG